MSTILFPSPIFGPVHSRRLGISLGINLLPADGKICSFDCIYCECGLNGSHRPHLRMPSRALVRSELEGKLAEMAAAGQKPDAITFAGNGEPTGHPEFAQIVDDVIKLDNALLKLDTVNLKYIELVNRPQGRYDLERLVEKMKAFEGNCMIQTMFMKGSWEGKSVDNTSERFVGPWLAAVKAIRPKLVTIYTIDRETPDKSLEKATHEELDRIAARLREAGLECTVSY